VVEHLTAEVASWMLTCKLVSSETYHLGASYSKDSQVTLAFRAWWRATTPVDGV
jgi:hypothetical protein